MLASGWLGGANPFWLGGANPFGIPLGFSLVIGCIYGLASGACFLLSAVTFRGVRVALYGATLLIGALALTAAPRWMVGHSSEPVHYVLFLGGMIVVQAALLPLLRFPHWSIARGSVPERRRQFQIGDLLVATTILAILFAAGTHYSPPVERQLFWQVLLGCWLFLPSVAVVAMAAALHHRSVSRLGFGGLCLLLVAATTLGLSYAEVIAGRDGAPATSWLWSLYGTLIGSYAWVVGSIGIAGRRDARDFG